LRAKTLVTALGSVELQRAFIGARAVVKGSFPSMRNWT
jgi:hypothetical protein